MRMTTPASPDRALPAAGIASGPVVRPVPRTVHGEPAVRRLWRTCAPMFTGTRAARELAELAAAVQVPLSTGRRIAVVPAHGGAGASTVAAVLASVYAVRRADPVLAADAASEHGPLTWRLGAAGGRTMAGLAGELLAARSGGLSGFAPLLPRTGTGLWVLPGGAGGQPGLCRDLTRAMSRVFAVCVTDCPGGVDAPATAAVVSEAHAVVLTTTATPDGVRLAYQRLADLAAAGHPCAPDRVVVAVNGAGARAAARDDVARTASDRLGVPAVSVPHDRHLAGGARIVPSHLAEPTTVATTRLAGLALTRARPW
jgi:MinD-like ATPase involved in chromosome partitioning or flagellar assembly